MFQSISWQQYFTCIFIATILYYLFIWIYFFKGRFPELATVANFRAASPGGEDAPDEIISTAQHVMDEVRPLFGNVNNKKELILALQLRLDKYAAWDEPGFRETINQFIRKESQSKCSIRLEAEDQRALWLQA
jgi:hypothetical protein